MQPLQSGRSCPVRLRRPRPVRNAEEPPERSMNTYPPSRTRRSDYGIDAPGIRRAMLIAGSIGLVTGIAPPLIWNASPIATWISAIGFVVAAYGMLMGSYMTYGSRIGKLRSREKLLDLAATLRPWTGDEIVLDVGCGRGLMLVGAARRLTTGHAVGIDLWREEDQSENSPEALEANARSEGVADRIRTTRAMRANCPTPMPVSMWCYRTGSFITSPKKPTDGKHLTKYCECCAQAACSCSRTLQILGSTAITLHRSG